MSMEPRTEHVAGSPNRGKPGRGPWLDADQPPLACPHWPPAIVGPRLPHRRLLPRRPAPNRCRLSVPPRPTPGPPRRRGDRAQQSRPLEPSRPVTRPPGENTSPRSCRSIKACLAPSTHETLAVRVDLAENSTPPGGPPQINYLTGVPQSLERVQLAHGSEAVRRSGSTHGDDRGPSAGHRCRLGPSVPQAGVEPRRKFAGFVVTVVGRCRDRIGGVGVGLARRGSQSGSRFLRLRRCRPRRPCPR